MDTTDGMEREWDIGEEGAVFLPPQRTKSRNTYIRKCKDHSAVELKKRSHLVEETNKLRICGKVIIKNQKDKNYYKH